LEENAPCDVWENLEPGLSKEPIFLAPSVIERPARPAPIETMMRGCPEKGDHLLK
jgi:hypothetical protein